MVLRCNDVTEDKISFPLDRYCKSKQGDVHTCSKCIEKGNRVNSGINSNLNITSANKSIQWLYLNIGTSMRNDIDGTF
ncbi:hypothetical protein KPH14_009575 [Odynerus spinipes]|uniref:Uncharacterized protein n=1 Tax=Odynerus spinipes TaxID=1348599 RepID=A0AAD9VQU6_9HYME|nr:hypothetical protein KPH14_009575 [Odynerus spinipes]